MIPNTFTLMSEEMIKDYFTSYESSIPRTIYRNGYAFFSVKDYEPNMENKGISKHKKIIKKIYDDNSSSVWFQDKVEVISGKDVGVLEVLIRENNIGVYHLNFFFELDGKLMVCEFFCPEIEMNDYKPVARNIMNSLNIK